ncbi:AraC family transcriptional regulator [Gordonia malaquae]|uniref:helix-turn-helix domain-containing protein n=1 Tax=Gordonia malaquae TaxID=410332 RepID=UPI0030FF0E82
MTALLALPARADSPGHVHSEVVPPGYLLTTRFLGCAYIDDQDGCSDEPHSHPEHVVFWPERGSGHVDVGDRRWSLATGQGLWVSAGVEHSVSRDPASTMAAVYIVPDAWTREAGPVRPVVVNAALRELLTFLAWSPMPRDHRLRAQQVCMELITEESRPAIDLPIPRDARIEEIARSIVADPADDRSIDDWAYLTSQSSRTIARAFRTETGMTFTQWRTCARMSRAVNLLGEGMAVGLVAKRVGYGTNSAFTAAFHRILNQPPTAFLPSRVG